jgi:pimeloyl-ACP methyl ester carboxylesterase
MLTHRDVEVGTVQLRIAEAGTGPLVILLHGFPETWYSWRHQFAPLVEAGYHVVAPTQRGYGHSARPAPVDAYTILHLVGDVVGLIHALGAERAILVGHDWGAPVAWTTAQLRPDIITAVAGLSVAPAARAARPPLATLRDRFDGQFYWNYFETPGVAEAELSADVDGTLRRVLYSASGDNPDAGAADAGLVPPGAGFLARTVRPDVLPPWLSEADLAVFVEEFTYSGFTGGLNWYRNIDRNWELTAAWADSPIRVPALFMVGERDLVYHFPGAHRAVSRLTELHPRMREPVVLPGCGHWIQQERPAEVTEALLEFLTPLRS